MSNKGKNIKVSIITVCFNSEKTIARTIESVLSQTYENIEYIIIDGASKDGTMAVIDSYRERFAGKLTVVSEPDTGIYNAMNKGIKLATGDIVGIVNSDDYYEADAVEKVVAAYDGEKYEIVYGIVRFFKGDTMLDAQLYTHHNLNHKCLMHPACFVTNAVYKEIAVYNEKYRAVADYDFLLCMKESGKVKFLPLYELLSNFSIEGVSASVMSKKEALKMQKEHGLIGGFVYVLKLMNMYINRLAGK